MNKKVKSGYLNFNKHFIVITLLTLGTILGLSIINRQTNIRQQAAQITDLNTANEIENVINLDGTMGPKTKKENFAGQLPVTYLGDLNLNLKAGQNSSLQSTTLSITISKVETHLIHLFIPGITDQYKSENQKKVSNQKTNQNVNKWEIIELNENSAPFEINFLEGQTFFLGTTPLAGGKYSEIRLYISKAEAGLGDGKKVDLNIPESYKTIRIVRPFNIYAGKNTTLTINLDMKNSIIGTGDNLIFKPVISNFIVEN